MRILPRSANHPYIRLIPMAHLNKLSAHIALFRALPSSHLETIETDIQSTCHQHHPFPITTTKPFLLPHGLGLHMHALPAKDIYTTLRE